MCECTCTSCLGTGCSARPPQHSPWLTPTGWMAFSPFSSFPAPDLWITSVCPWVSRLPCRASFYLFGKRGVLLAPPTPKSCPEGHSGSGVLKGPPLASDVPSLSLKIGALRGFKAFQCYHVQLLPTPWGRMGGCNPRF